MEKITENVFWTKDEKMAEELSQSNVTEYVEPNYVLDLFDGQESSVSNGWAYETMQTQYAIENDLTGEGIRIAVIDSGVDVSNNDLQNAVIEDGYDYVADSSEMKDDVYHGTRVIQVIAGDENGLGGTGIAMESTIIPLRCFSSSGGGTVKIIVQAILDAVNSYDCDIINMSWGMSSDSQTLHDAITYAHEKGTIMVTAAGNVSSSYPQGTLFYPAAYDEVLGISSVDKNLKVASDSQNHQGVFVCAPGVALPTILANGKSSTASGTSFAAPVITGEIALLKQLAPFLDLDDLKQILIERSEDLGESGYDIKYGFGIPKIDRVLSDHWGKIEAEDEATVRIKAWLLTDSEGRVIISGHEDDNQQSFTRFYSISETERSVNNPIPSDDNEVSMIFLDNQYCPVGAMIEKK